MMATPKLPAIIASRYVPVGLIGKGGMGAVYEVEHARTGERLALKVLLSSVGASQDALERFKREARASARIKSEHVVRVTDADVAPELDGAPFLVMELLEGIDLERAAVSLPPPTPAQVVEWLGQVALAIDKAHRLGIVHRDLKPENLFLATTEGRPTIVKILDFGIAKMAQEGSLATASGQILGTPRYMAPEQAAGGANITPAADLYALGLIAYRLIVGENYHLGDNIVAILGQVLHGELKPPSQRNPSVPPAFDAWFMKACDRNPERRFGSAAEQTEALAAALGFAVVSIARPTEGSSGSGSGRSLETAPTLAESESGRLEASPRPTKKPRRAMPFLAASIGVAIALGVGAAILMRPSSATPPPALRGVASTASAGPTPGAPAAIPPIAAAPGPPSGAAAPTANPSPPETLTADGSAGGHRGSPTANAPVGGHGGPLAGSPRGTGKPRRSVGSSPRLGADSRKPSADDPFGDQK